MSFPKLTDGKLTQPLRYSSPQDVRMRLRSTLIRYQDIPVWVEDVEGENLQILVNDLLGLLGKPGIMYSIHSSSENLDISSPPIGWIKTQNTALLLARAPTNSQKQGLCPSQLLAYRLSNGRLIRTDNPDEMYFSWRGLGHLVPLAMCIKGDFPLFLDILKQGEPSPLSREWALAPLTPKYWSLYHHSHPVALVDTKARNILFGRQHTTKTQTMEIRSLLSQQGVLNFDVETLN